MAELASTTVYGDLRVTGSAYVPLPTVDEHAATKAYVDAQIVDAKARSNHTGTQPLSTITGHDKAAHDALNINADTVDGQHASAFATSGHNHDASYAPTTHNHSAGQITSGTFADARIAQSNVTQHQGAITITESQISNLDHYTTTDANAAIDARVTKTFVDALNINADTVDGQHASAFATSGHTHNYSPDTHNHDSTYVNSNTAITAGTATKITYDSKGLVTGGASLTSGDIPNLATSKITSGTFADARISATSVTQHVTKTYVDSLNINADTVDGSHASSLLSRSNHTGTQPISTLSNHDKASHDSLGIDADTVDGQHASAFALSSHGHAGGYSAVIGNGVSTQIVITHNLGSTDVIVQLSDTSGTSVVDADIQITDNNTVTLDFNSPPASNSIKAVILSATEYSADIVVSRARTVLPFGMEGPLEASTGKAQFPIPFNCSIIDVRARVSTPPSGDSIVVDVNKNGSTVFTTQADRPTIIANENNSSTNLPTTTLLTAGDWVSVDIDQVGSGAAGSDLVVVITVREEL